jgi:hypothetical protein
MAERKQTGDLFSQVFKVMTVYEKMMWGFNGAAPILVKNRPVNVLAWDDSESYPIPRDISVWRPQSLPLQGLSVVPQ